MIINFSLEKIIVIKSKEPTGNLEAKNNVKITNISEQNIASIAKTKAALNIHFSFTIAYEPNIAEVNFEGKVLYLTDEKTKKSMLDEWKKDKKIDPKISQPILNNILTKCNIKALTLTNDVNLPPHIPFPRLALKSDVDTQRTAS